MPDDSDRQNRGPGVVFESPEGEEERLPRFTNYANVGHSPHGFVLTFGFLDNLDVTEAKGGDDSLRSRVVARVAMSPTFLLTLAQTLIQNYAEFQIAFPQAVPRGGELTMEEVPPEASGEMDKEEDQDEERGADGSPEES